MTVRPETPPVLLASIALEPNRWKKAAEKVPSLKVSEWGRRAAEAGFAGWELWEHHYFLADGDERAGLAGMDPPVRIFNTYLIPGIDDASAWQRVADAVKALCPDVGGIKFNLGREDVPVDRQVEAALRWADQLPEEVRMLCECHPGTVLEEPGAAARAFQRWPAERFAAILHPMNADPGHIDRWFEVLGSRITHLHWQGRDDNRRVRRLGDLRERLDVAILSLQRNGFSGTQSVEFVEGLGRPGECVAGLFEAAAADRKALGEAWAAVQRG